MKDLPTRINAGEKGRSLGTTRREQCWISFPGVQSRQKNLTSLKMDLNPFCELLYDVASSDDWT